MASSSYGKRTWFHQMIGVMALLAMIVCFLMVDHKPCQIPLLARDELPKWMEKPIPGTEISTKTLRQQQNPLQNSTLKLIWKIERFVQDYYDQLQLFHLIIGAWSLVIILLGFINIVPKHEDLKVITILLLVIIMGLAALFAFYTAFMAFHKPCRSLPGATAGQITRAGLRYLSKLRLQLQATLSSSLTNQTSFRETNHDNESSPSIYILEFRSVKDKRPVNVFEDDDETMIRVTLINAATGFILLCSDFLFFFDSRQHMIEWRN